jgi:hypothetical protein
MAYFAVLAVTDNSRENNVVTDVVFNSVGSYKSALDFHAQLYEKMNGMSSNPFSKKHLDMIRRGGVDIHALLIDPDIFHICRELKEKGHDGEDLLQRKVLAKFDVTDYVAAVIDEKWPEVEEKPAKKKK